jgi:hypothetical protein
MENVHPRVNPSMMLSTETKIKGIEERLHRLGVTEETKFQTISDHTAKTEELLSNERLADQLISDRLSKDLELLAQGSAADLNSVRQHRKEAEGRLERQAMQRGMALVEEFRRERDEENKRGNSYDRLGEEIPKLRHAVEQIRLQRKNVGTKLEGAIGEELEKMAGTVDVEKRIRIQQQNTLLKTMEDFAARIETEVSNLKYERHQSTEHLLNLLEEACARTEARVQLRTPNN